MSDSPDYWDYDPEDDEGPDPATVAFLDQETEEFNSDAAKFVATFGFEHHCTCAQDYTEGRLAETTHCFGSLCLDALEACKRLKEENELLLEVFRKVLNQEPNDRTDPTEGLSQS